MPTQRELFTAHERRAQTIAQLQEHAGIRARDLAAQRKMVPLEIAVGVQRRKVMAWLIVAAAVFWGSAILLLGYVIAKGL
jgi:hypothetical protein